MDFLDDWNTPEGVGAVEFGATAAAPGQDLFDVEVVKDYISRWDLAVTLFLCVYWCLVNIRDIRCKRYMCINTGAEARLWRSR